MKAAIYARYSSDLQRQASIADQYRTCFARVEREGWTVVAKYKDEAISGANADRPGYVELMKAAKAGEFDVIVVEEVSRLWRDQETQWHAVKRLEYWGVHIIGCNDGIDTRQGYGLLLGIRGALNEETRREIGKRTHRGLAGVALNGRSAGGKAYGYKNTPEYHATRKDAYGRPVVVGVHKGTDGSRSTFSRRWVKCATCGGNYTIVGNQSYGCANHKERGDTVCANKVRVGRRELETKLLEGIRTRLFTAERLERFKRASARLLAEARRQPDLAEVEAKIAKVDGEIANMVDAIKRGAYCDQLQAELDGAKAERERLARLVDVPGFDKIAHVLPRAAERFKEAIDDLENVTPREVARARAQIRQLVGGEIRFVPEGAKLYAEMRGSYAGLLKLATAGVPRRGLEPPRGCPH
jgi:DNA invertase Pin-like site-specific DNA recombinase